jgi:hypothetical protein
MEILIPGLLLVALMVYASTRIKRTAAEAFESETIETDDFVIQKPEGMLNIVNGDPRFVFEAYARDYGKEDAAEVRQVTAELMVTDRSLDVTLADAKADGFSSEFSEVVDGVKYHIVEAETENKGNAVVATYKIASKNGKSYRMLVKRLGESDEENTRRAANVLDGFELK